MRIIVLGSGSIVPTEKRYSSSILLEIRGERILLDIGPGTVEKLRRLGIDPNTIGRLLITHFHVDHVTDLPALIKLRAFDRSGYAAHPPHHLHIYGPRGLVEFMDKLVAPGGVFGYLAESIGCMRLLTLHEAWEGVVEEAGNLRILAAPVEHFKGVAYRVEADGNSLVYSGDAVPDERLIKLAEKVDILIHECSFPHGGLLGKHTSDEQLAEIAARIEPKLLIAVHLYPVWEGREEELRDRLEGVFEGRVIVAEDMEIIEV